MRTPGQAIREQFGELGEFATSLELRVDESMARHTTLRLGGPADLWARPSDIASLAFVLSRVDALGLPLTFVGGGTNLLVRDAGIPGVVVNLGRINDVERPRPEAEPNVLEVQAGSSTGRLLKRAIDWGLGGLEFLGGVPGSVGGGLVMNAGTYLGEFTDVVHSVRSLRRDGSEVVRSHAQCGFRYRDSDLPRDELIVDCVLHLAPRSRADIESDVRGLRTRREEREPKGVPNSGSTFKNPTGDHAGRLIETAELKGVRRGGAIVSPKHANWLVVDKEHEVPCTASDLLALIEHVRTTVETVHGIRLQNEVKVIGVDQR